MLRIMLWRGVSRERNAFTCAEEAGAVACPVRLPVAWIKKSTQCRYY
jgi:hypothetical protein